MLHTIVDYNVFLAQMQPAEEACNWITLPSGKLEVTSSGTVKRICSTDLQDYLDIRYSPGSRYGRAVCKTAKR